MSTAAEAERGNKGFSPRALEEGSLALASKTVREKKLLVFQATKSVVVC